MAKIKVTNPKQIINGGAKKYYFKVKGVGGIKGDKGDKGDTGSQGPQGPQGNAATIMVGSTTTLPTGYDATVTNTGTINNAILNFGIPRGIKGDTGAKGDKGDKGDKGEQGNTGPQGPAGQNATVYVGTTTTGAAGTQASVYNSGTERNAVLNFTIPQGAKGDTGATGATGPQGPAGQDGQNFTPTVVDSLPATGDQSKLYLTPKDYTAGTATGNPITISLDEDAGQITSAQLDGDTYQQSYTGKNLIKFPYDFGNSTTIRGVTATANADGSITLNGTNDGTGTSIFYLLPQFWNYADGDGKAIELSAGQTVTMSLGNGNVKVGFRSEAYYNTSPSTYEQALCQIAPQIITVTANARMNARFIAYSGTSFNNETFYPMIELGSTATTYEPYVGGIPSPNPDYPQQIQTVTGTQTVAINGTDYPISLGSIELCKLGDYQDYIYKSGSDWKVHEATNKVTLTGAEYWQYPNIGTVATFFQLSNTSWDNAFGANSHPIGEGNGNTPEPTTAFVCDILQSINGEDAILKTNQGTGKKGRWFRISLLNTWNISTVEQLQTWLSNHNATVYYAKATPTDTTITDQTLIAQLEAVRNATLQASNTITNTATGTNLAGDLELGYYEYDPQNRYDKWLWLDLNNNYEKLGS